MPSLNLTAIGASLRCLITPRLLVPTLHVRDIRCLDWRELKRKGYVGVVIDKDNCITKPYHDQLVPELQNAWQSCLATFGKMGVLLVSNSAGTVDDPALIQAESVARHLGVPVLVHATKKPGRQVVKAIEQYFTADYRRVPVIHPSTKSNAGPLLVSRNRSDPTPLKLVVIGDRVTTDIILASRLRAHLQRRPSTSTHSSIESNPVVSVLTQQLWQKEKLGTRFMRWAENRALKLVMQHSTRRSTINEKEPSSSSRRLPSLTNIPEELVQGFHRSLSYSSQVLLKAGQTKEHLLNKYDSISVSLRQTSQQPLSAITTKVMSMLKDILSHQLGHLSARCSRALTRVKIALRQYLITIFETLKNRALQAAVRSMSKVQPKLQSSHPFDPVTLGFKTPMFLQHLSKWKQLK
ncbi:hypothetical protein MJO29_001608 [Puccinia striiformis f. sp. tritici]|uniref:hypothetical protein n=1 Tax=Puccinia striiformis f. sp. tritici TaxID=168172 RepID=UPI002008400B|nr:hypothetical protein Pst134EA_003183 [Puccinia striiformis f. sp. tritici]KAH9472574.1 hypothetical protein Pst134EA_003183 [Puccinia striiformis f. sp. tritici]KAI7965860.1 hypothetical protein MJO29_001608 [Puccinia striiformis f. sp. tritici]